MAETSNALTLPHRTPHRIEDISIVPWHTRSKAENQTVKASSSRSSSPEASSDFTRGEFHTSKMGVIEKELQLQQKAIGDNLQLKA